MNNRDPRLIREIMDRFHAKRFAGKVKKDFHLWLISTEDYAAKDEAMRELWLDLADGSGRQPLDSLRAVKVKLGMIPEKKNNVTPLNRALARVAAVMLPVAIMIGIYFIHNAASQEMEWARIEVPYGQTGCYNLADGTCVWLNAGSSLEYPVRFRGKQREVRLCGEGFFSVAPNRRKPFVVVSDHLRTEVLGTKFNICSYAGQRYETVTVLNGEVLVTTEDDMTHDLVADRHLTHTMGDMCTDVEEVDAAAMICWMNKGLVFENCTLEDILCRLQRTYNFSVMVDQAQLTDAIYCMRFVNGEPVGYMLDVLYRLIGIPYSFENNTLVVGADKSKVSELNGYSRIKK